MIGAAVLGGLVAFVPQDFQPYVVASFALALLIAPLFAYPELLPYFVLFSSSFTGLLRNFDSLGVGITSVTVSGLRWAGIGGMALLLGGMLWLRFQSSIPRYYLLFVPFLVWTITRWVTSPWRAVGAKDVLFYSLPLLIGLYTFIVLVIRGGRITRSLEKTALWTAFIPGLLYAILIPAGLVRYTKNGPKGIMGARGVVVYLLVILPIALANWRYGRSFREKRYGLLISLVIVGTILFTLSRTASLVALGLFVLRRVNPSKPVKAVLGGILATALALTALLLIPSFKERFFFGSTINLSSEYAVRALNTSGRNRMWPTTYDHALKRHVAGWGPGSARLLVAREVFSLEKGNEYFPHNEYLQIFHDLGIVGLILWLLIWVPVLLKHWKRWKAADRSGDDILAKWEMAATLCIVIILLTAITDNTFHYAHVMGPSFIIIALGDYWYHCRSAES